MSQYVLRSVGQKSDIGGPFAVIPYNGTKPISIQEKGYAVNDGICFSTFSYNSGSYVPIEDMNTAFSLGKDFVVYLRFGISSNMQVTGASVMAGPVGNKAIGADFWKEYPDFYRISGPPAQTKNINGQNVVISVPDGRRQDSAFLMIGKCYDSVVDIEKNNNFIPVSSSSRQWTGFFVQHVNSNIILMGSNVSGIPILFPMPFWNAPGTSDKNKLFPSK